MHLLPKYKIIYNQEYIVYTVYYSCSIYRHQLNKKNYKFCRDENSVIIMVELLKENVTAIKIETLSLQNFI